MIEYGLLTFASLFAIVNPVGAIPAFMVMTANESVASRKYIAKVASVTCLVVLAAFALLGPLIFKIFGITLPAFQMAGGIVLFLSSIDMLRARRTRLQETHEERDQGSLKEDIAITPLAIPMLSGPGAISTVIVLSGQAQTFPRQIILYVSILLASAATYGVLRFAASSAQRLNRIVMNIITRLMGLLLTAIAVQFIASALPGILPKNPW